MSLYLNSETENLMQIIKAAKKNPVQDLDEEHQLTSVKLW